MGRQGSGARIRKTTTKFASRKQLFALTVFIFHMTLKKFLAVFPDTSWLLNPACPF